MSKFSSWLAPQQTVEINGVTVTLVDPGIQALDILPNLMREMPDKEEDLTKQKLIDLVKNNAVSSALVTQLVYLCIPELADERIDLGQLRTPVLVWLLQAVFAFVSTIYPESAIPKE